LGPELHQTGSTLGSSSDVAGERAGTVTAVSRSRPGIAHPIWLVALAVLALNDHVLKGAGLLPGWLTGKLSDFAGLIVAPVLLAAVTRARRPGARAAACALVAAGFAAIKLSPLAARAFEDAMARLHVPSRVWSDPTDLVALVALPVAWWLTGWRRPAAARRPGGVARARDRALVIGGALACLATSKVEPYSAVEIRLQNRTFAARTVAVYRAAPLTTCTTIDALAAATFTIERCVELGPGNDVAIGTIFQVNEGALPPDAGGGVDCHAVAIRTANLADTVLLWPTIASADLKNHDNVIYLEEVGARLFLAGTDAVDAAPAAFALPASGCAGLP
jgi:hypothetical protein